MMPVTKELMYDYLKLHKTLRKELIADQVSMEGVKSPGSRNPDEAPGGYSPPKTTQWNSKITKMDEKKNKMYEIEDFVNKALSGDKYSIINLYYFCDYELKEIASEINLSYHTVERYKRDAIDDLVMFANSNNYNVLLREYT